MSNYAREMLPKLFMSDPRRDTDTKKAFIDSFAKTQQLIEEHKTIDAATSGTTATVAYKKRSSDELFVAYVGDSRAVLVCEKALGVGTNTKTA